MDPGPDHEGVHGSFDVWLVLPATLDLDILIHERCAQERLAHGVERETILGQEHGRAWWGKLKLWSHRVWIRVA